MNNLVTAIFVSVLILLACGWTAKLIAECEIMDVFGLVASCLALGYLAGVWL